MDEDEVTKRESYAEDNTLDLTGFGDNNMDHGVLYGPQPVSTGLQKKYQDARLAYLEAHFSDGFKVIHCQGKQWGVPMAMITQTSPTARNSVNHAIQSGQVVAIITVNLHHKHPHVVDRMVYYFHHSKVKLTPEVTFEYARNDSDYQGDLRMSLDTTTGQSPKLTTLHILSELLCLAMSLEDAHFQQCILAKLRYNLHKAWFEEDELIDELEEAFLATDRNPLHAVTRKLYLTGALLHSTTLCRSHNARKRLLKLQQESEDFGVCWPMAQGWYCEVWMKRGA